MSTADEGAAAYRGASRRLQIDIAALDEYLRPMVLVARIVATGLVAPAAVLLTEHVNDEVFGRQARRLVNSLNGNLKQHLSVAVEASSRSAN